MAAHEKAQPDLLTGEAGTAFLDRNRLHATGPISAAQAPVVLGVDIGASGAIALVTRAGDLFAVEDMPTLRDGPAGRRNVNAAFVSEIISKSHATEAFVEYVGARPGEGLTGAFSSDAAVESWRVSWPPLASRGFPYPAIVETSVGIAPGKDEVKLGQIGGHKAMARQGGALRPREG